MDPYRLFLDSSIYNNPWIHRQAIRFSGIDKEDNRTDGLENRVDEAEKVSNYGISRLSETTPPERTQTRYTYGYNSDGVHLREEKGKYVDEKV